ncbi:histidine kinase dimerization/phosphoacceptor domain -containing protein [uncultured Tateyamaria sp.]|uniref:sensor histidine kinase n=1 Tax=uncultured Tateyamaria sp. TaxID=455651 RepID=UPI0026199D18|nr:histidine kinase dimerization/phosphoacceptor domain -containing protein [uncultured Tateyamaria sp.]
MKLPSFGGLRVRLLLLMLLALFPLGLIAMWQTFRVVEESRILNKRILVDMTTAAADDQRNLVQRAVGAGAGLGALVMATDLDACRAGMVNFLAENDMFAFAGYIPVSGVMACSSAGDAVVDFSGYPSFAAAVERGSVFVEVNDAGAVSGMPVVIVNVPLRQDGALQGFVSLSLPQRTLLTSDDPSVVDGPTLIAISSGGIAFALSDTLEDVAAIMPQDVPAVDLFARAGTTFVGVANSGERRVFSVTDAVEDGYVILGSWPQTDLMQRHLWAQAALPALFAVLMWGASMLVAYFGLDRLVLRHLKELRSAMRQFALGERKMDGLKLEDAPDEFLDAQRAFNRMTLLITEAEARQLTDLHDKEVLLREVHHRVKNNLQMIASIMNLQSRSARTDEAREVLGGLQRRVRGLATLHRSLYTQPETSQVDAQDLLGAVVSESSAVLPGTDLQIRTELASAMLYPDQAVPLSMWASEALTNAVKYVGRNGVDTPFIAVTLSHDGAGQLELTIENSVGSPLVDGPMNDVESTGLGTKLMNAFCRQLEAKADIREADGTFTNSLTFDVQGYVGDTDDDSENANAAP